MTFCRSDARIHMVVHQSLELWQLTSKRPVCAFEALEDYIFQGLNLKRSRPAVNTSKAPEMPSSSKHDAIPFPHSEHGPHYREVSSPPPPVHRVASRWLPPQASSFNRCRSSLRVGALPGSATFLNGE
jgi:hypothetical protein